MHKNIYLIAGLFNLPFQLLPSYTTNSIKKVWRTRSGNVKITFFNQTTAKLEVLKDHEVDKVNETLTIKFHDGTSFYTNHDNSSEIFLHKDTFISIDENDDSYQASYSKGKLIILSSPSKKLTFIKKNKTQHSHQTYQAAHTSLEKKMRNIQHNTAIIKALLKKYQTR